MALVSASATRNSLLRTSPFVTRDSMFLERFPPEDSNKPPLRCTSESLSAYTTNLLVSPHGEESFTALMVVATNKAEGVLRAFLDIIKERLSGSALKNAILAQDSQGWTAWHHAAAVTNQEGLRLLDAFATFYHFGDKLSSNLKNKGNQTPLDILQNHNFEENPPSLSRLFDEDGHLHTVKSIRGKFGIEYTDNTVPTSHENTWQMTTHFEESMATSKTERLINSSLKHLHSSFVLQHFDEINGYGIVAKGSIPSGYPIIVNSGLYISKPLLPIPIHFDPLDNLFSDHAEQNSESKYRIEERHDSEHAGNLLLWCNHGFPNSTLHQINGQSQLTSISPINSGDQILWSYGHDYISLNLGPMHVFNKPDVQKFFTDLKQNNFEKLPFYFQSAFSNELPALLQKLEFIFSNPIFVFYLVGNKICTIANFEALIYQIEIHSPHNEKTKTIEDVIFGKSPTRTSAITRMTIMRLAALKKLAREKPSKVRVDWKLILDFFAKHAESYSVAQFMKAVQLIETRLKAPPTAENFENFLVELENQLQSYRYTKDTDRPFKVKDYKDYLMRPHSRIPFLYLKFPSLVKSFLNDLKKEYRDYNKDVSTSLSPFTVQSYLEIFSEGKSNYPALAKALSPIIEILTLRSTSTHVVLGSQYALAIENLSIETTLKYLQEAVRVLLEQDTMQSRMNNLRLNERSS